MNLINMLLSASWIGPLITALIMVVSGIYIKRSAKTEADKAAKAAYEGAITAMKAHIDALQDRVEDAEKENSKLQQTLETICSALEMKGMYITIQGHMVSIREGKETTTTRIKGTLHGVEEETK